MNINNILNTASKYLKLFQDGLPLLQDTIKLIKISSNSKNIEVKEKTINDNSPTFFL